MAILNIRNDIINVEIDTYGAQLKSVKDKNNVEYIWDRDPSFWGKSAPVLFPICGTLKDGKYIYEGREYKLCALGFAKKMDYSVREHTDDKLVLYITDTEETMEMYPFAFDFEVSFELKDNSVRVEYAVTNKGDGDMYYSVGCHEAYATPEGVEEYAVEFPSEVAFDTYLLDGPLINGKILTLAEKGRVFDIKEKYFDLDSVCLKNMGVHSATLVHKKSNRRVRVDFPDFDYFLIWHEPNAGFLCLEPWRGFPDHVDHDYDLTKKDGIIKVEKGQRSISEHTIYFG